MIRGAFWGSAGILGCLLFLPTVHAQQVRDPRLSWKTLETENFRIHYPTPLEPVARRAAAVCERVNATLVPILGNRQSQVTQVVLTDDSDSANGSATALPYNQMRLFASAPEDLTPLGDYDDWLGTLITHEHTHILHLDDVGGIPALINVLFGKVYTPNSAQPRWFIEGYAVHEESAETAGGRIRSTMFEMYVRMAALEDALLGIDELSNGVDRWPQGNAFYLYGSRFVDWIADQYGRQALAEIAHAYGRQLIPYALNRTARRVTGKTFVELYDAWRAASTAHHRQVAADVTARGLRVGTRLTHHGQVARQPRFLSDDTIGYSVADGENDTQIRRIDLSGRRPRPVVRTAGTGGFSLHPDGRSLYYESADAHRDIYFFTDLFRKDLESGEIERLTDGMRAREPDVSPNGRHIAFVVNQRGTSHLMIAEVDDIAGTAEPLVRSRLFGQVYTPRFSPDGRSIAYSVWEEGGYRDVHVVDVATGRVRRITHDRALDTGPTWSPDGETLYFSSDRTGIANLYAFTLATGAEHQITNVIAGAYSPSVSPGGDTLVYLGYSSIGWDIWTIPLAPEHWDVAEEYVDARPAGSETRASWSGPARRYRPAETVYPRNWLLSLEDDGFGSNLGVTLESSDAVGFYEYSARIGVSLTEGYVNADASWVFRHVPAPIRLRLFRRVSPRGGLQVGGTQRRWVEDAVGGEIGIGYSFPRSFHSESVSLSYGVTNLRKGEPFGGVLDPNTPPPVLPQTGLVANLRGGWSYSDVRRHAFDMTPSEGRSFGFAVSFADPLIGSQYRSISFSWSFNRFLEAPWAQHHVFALRYAGGLSGGDLGRRGVFSVGGFSEVSILDALRNDIVLGGQALRGYPPFTRTGTQYHLTQLEYRLPLWRPMWGPETLPFYVRRLYGSVFVDVGDAFSGNFDPRTLRVGSGVELLLDFAIGYYRGLTLRGGFAYGFMDGGGAQGYVNIGVPF